MSTPALSNLLTGMDLQRALNLWRRGYNTYQIAWHLQATEAAVYNGLHEIRELKRRRAA